MEFAADPTRLIISAILGIALLLALIIKGKFHPLVAIIISAVCIGLGAGMPFEMITSTVAKGMGNTLQGIALLVGFGSMFGAILEISGGAERMALTMVKAFGEKRAPWALGFTGMIVAIPVFFDAGLIILIPLAFSVARRTGKSTLAYGIPLLAGLAAGHAFIPPTPGPILVAGILGVDLALVILVGIILGTVAMIVAGPLFGGWVSQRIFAPVPDSSAEGEAFDESKLPSFATVLGIILVPLVLILLSSASDVIPFMASAKPFFKFLGTPFIALIIAVVLAMFLLGIKNGYSIKELEKVMGKSLEPAGMILLVTAGGGVLRYMLQDSGLGDIIGSAVSSSALPMVVVAFIIAVAVRVSVGSATVAMTMAAGIVASMPETSSLSQLYLACMVMAIASGSTVLSHVNDSGFWLVKSLFRLDEKTTLKTWTVMETIVGSTGFILALAISFFV
jgi:GntP family gluconate:H+ symporter/Gnt-I system low-affinity gluconate transporter